MRSRQKPKFFTTARHTYQLELVLEFAAPVTAIRAKEVARRIVDGLHLATEQPRVPADLREAQVICHALGRILPLPGPERELNRPEARTDAATEETS
jgi:hypothetical protein